MKHTKFIAGNAERLWPECEYVPEQTRQNNIAKWQNALAHLGANWLGVKYVEKKATHAEKTAR